MKLLKTLIFLLFVLFAVIAVYAYNLQQKEYFFEEFAILYNVNDMGVAPLENDELYRWTINHSAMQVITKGGLEQPNSATAKLNMLQDPNVPFMEPPFTNKLPSKPISIYIDHNTLVLEANNELVELSGEIKIPWEAKGVSTGQSQINTENCADNGFCTLLPFTLKGISQIKIDTIPENSNGFPIDFILTKDTNLNDVAVGNYELPPPSHKFSYHSKDRHAWALKTNVDGNKDIFVSRGGARGLLDQAHPGAKDEYFRWSDTTYRDIIDQLNITKSSCPGRQASWFDVNNDGLLDLYQVCGRLRGDNSEFPNRLYIQTSADEFSEQASDLGVDFSSAGSFQFIKNRNTVTGEAYIQLIWATDDSVEVFQLQNNYFEPIWSTPRVGSFTDDISVGDVDADGQWEALIFAQYDSKLLSLGDGQVNEIDLRTLGLPQSSMGGGFLDADNNGLHDLLILPYGIYLNEESQFKFSSALDLSWIRDWGEVRFAWLDQDKDGDLDLWVANNYANVPKSKLVWEFFARESLIPNELKTFALKVLRKLKLGYRDDRLWESRLYTHNTQKQCTRIVPMGPEGNVDLIGSKISIQKPEQPQASYFYYGFSDYAKYSQTMNHITYCGDGLTKEHVKSMDGDFRIISVE